MEETTAEQLRSTFVVLKEVSVVEMTNTKSISTRQLSTTMCLMYNVGALYQVPRNPIHIYLKAKQK